MDKKTKSCLDLVVKELQLDIVSSFNNSKKLKESERTTITSSLKAISAINREFGTNYQTTELCYYDQKRKSFDKKFKDKFPKENEKGYINTLNLLKYYKGS